MVFGRQAAGISFDITDHLWFMYVYGAVALFIW